ncbi:FlgB family protein [Alkalilacustris brevis]|uniref:FlgB family protein n=1 Tax=Alkalilacustris brevis TaxID=2026338 RepID=UPI000E0DA67E|nr:FlgB family protein [Alkalilacustris brevis]
MFDTPDLLKLAHASAAHAAQRQTVIAGNVANADTPGYKARDTEGFAAFLERTRTRDRATGPRDPAATRSQPPGAGAQVFELAAPAAPNGNTVSLEAEMVRAVETRHQHEMALSIYRSTSGILRAALGR